jgi:hypothetical protein
MTKVKNNKKEKEETDKRNKEFNTCYVPTLMCLEYVNIYITFA